LPERKTIAAYLEAVQGQIRWKRARPLLVRELERHLEDQRDDFLKEGKAPDEAERLAVEDMGDPVTVGTELDRIHRPRPQWGLLGLTIALAAIGGSCGCFSASPMSSRWVSCGSWPPWAWAQWPCWGCTFSTYPGWSGTQGPCTSARWRCRSCAGCFCPPPMPSP